MPRIPRVPEQETVHDRIMRSLGPAPPPEAAEGEGEPVEAGSVAAVDRPEPTNAELREWARAQEPPLEVGDSGPVPKHIREAYTAAHGG